MMMKTIFLAILSLIGTAVGKSGEFRFRYEDNPLVRHIYTADPSARVFDGRLYVYTSHDQSDSSNDKHFDMLDWHVFSTDDLENWVDHGAFFSLKDIPWASRQAWAPDCVERDGKYYFYYPVEQARIGVAVSDHPTKGFKDALGKPLIDKAWDEHVVGREPIDPGILLDDDGQAYMFFGCRDARVVKLKDSMIEIDGDILPVKIMGNEGHKENQGGWYGEAPWVFKRKGIYYLIYSNGWGNESTMLYATAGSPLGPYTFRGEVMSPSGAGTSHGSLVEYRGQWYVFYHDISLSNDGKRRSVCFDRIAFADDGTLVRLEYSRHKGTAED